MAIQILPTLFSATLLVGAPNLEAAMAKAMSAEDLSEAAVELEVAITAVLADPDTLAPAGGVEPQLLASLALLASLYIAEQQRSRAGEVIDTLLRLDPHQQAPVRSYGPELFELYTVRRDALRARGQATLEFVCHTPCELIVDGHHQAAPFDASLQLGPHVLWLRASDDASSAWERRELMFSEAGQSKWLEFGEPPPADRPPTSDQHPQLEARIPPAPALPPTAAHAEPLVSSSPPPRLLPRGFEVTGLVLGATALAIGVVMLLANGRCKSSWRPADASMNPSECETVLTPNVPGAAVLAGLGGTLALASSITLTVDEQRVSGARATQIALGYRFAF